MTEHFKKSHAIETEYSYLTGRQKPRDATWLPQLILQFNR